MKVKVAVCGPNLNNQERGQFHVHAAECGDLKHYGPEKKQGGDDQGWVIEVESAYEVSLAVYADHLSDYGLSSQEKAGKEMIQDWLSDFWFAPCVKELT